MWRRLTRSIPGGRAVWCAGAVMLLALLGSCSVEVEQMSSEARPMPPKPRPMPVAPPGTTADTIVLLVSAKPRDTNANHYPDLIDVLANLFSDAYAVPIYEEGVFVFRLYPGGRSDDPAATPLREWRIAGDALERAKVGRKLYGLTYGFQLSLLDNGGDQFPLMAADLTCRFEPADGRPAVVRREVHRMQIGANRPNR